MNKKDSPRLLRGIILLASAEFCFAVATVFAKLVTAHSNVPAIEMTFFRFLFGSVIAFLFIIKEKSPIAPKRWDLVIWRGVFNGTAVILFFLGVQHTTITNANILNMTYPAFLFITAAWINHEKSHPVMFIFLALTLTGITLVIHPDFHHIRIGDVYSLLSGVVTAFGVSTLRKARQFDSTASILFYMMSVGCIINLILVLPVFVIPHGLNLVFVLLSALIGVAGQACITSGYLYISAKSGGIISSSRIIFASILGVVIFQDPMNMGVIFGGLLIAISIIGVTLFQRGQAKKEKAEIGAEG